VDRDVWSIDWRWYVVPPGNDEKTRFFFASTDPYIVGMKLYFIYTYMYADEVNAVVLDVGPYQVKAGYAGEDAPKFICPTAVGVGGEVAGSPEQNGMEIDERQFHTGSNALETHRGGMEVVSPFKDGLLYDWEAVEALWDHILRYVTCMKTFTMVIQILVDDARVG